MSHQIVEAHADHLRVERGPKMRAAAQEYMARYAREITSLLQRMPRPLLLLLKTNDCLRSVDHALGQPTNTLAITARQCEAALARERLRGRPGLAVRLGVAWEAAQVRGEGGAGGGWGGEQGRGRLLGGAAWRQGFPWLGNLGGLGNARGWEACACTTPVRGLARPGLA